MRRDGRHVLGPLGETAGCGNPVHCKSLDHERVPAAPPCDGLHSLGRHMEWLDQECVREVWRDYGCLQEIPGSLSQAITNLTDNRGRLVGFRAAPKARRFRDPSQRTASVPS